MADNKNTYLDSKGYYFNRDLNIIPGQNMELSKITPKQAQEILKSNAINYIDREDLEELKLISERATTPNTPSGIPTPTRINQVLASVLVNKELVVKWVDLADLTARSKEFLSLNFMVKDGVLRIPLGEKIDLNLDLLPNTTNNTRPYKITYNNKTLEGEFTDEQLVKHFQQAWDTVNSKNLFRTSVGENLNIATFNLEDSFLSSVLKRDPNSFRLNSTDYDSLAGVNQNGTELTSLIKQVPVKEIVLDKVNDNDLVSLLVSLLNITVPVNKIVFETNVEKDYSQRFPNLSSDGKVLTYNIGEEMVLPYISNYSQVFVELNTDFCEKRALTAGAFSLNGARDGLAVKLEDNSNLTSTIYPKIGKAGPIFVNILRRIGNNQGSFVTLYSSNIEEKVKDSTVVIGNTYTKKGTLKTMVVEGQSEITFSKTDLADGDNKTVFEFLFLAGDLPPTVEKIVFKTDRVWDRQLAE